MELEGGPHRLRQLGHRGLHLPQGFARRRGRLGGSHPRVGRIRGGIEAGEQAPLEALPPSPVEGEVAHHPPDIGGLDRIRGLRRIRDEPEQHVLHNVLGLGRAAEDAARARQIGGAITLERREVPGSAGRLPAGARHGSRRDPLAGEASVVIPGRHDPAHIVPPA
ncbi:hypothetical protein JCM16408A_43270 [Methylobacterium phyllosphaerae]